MAGTVFLYNIIMEICKICNREFKNPLALATHIKEKHGVTSKEYYDKFLIKGGEGKCALCGEKLRFRGIVRGYTKYCKHCFFKAEETKEKIKATNLENLGVEWPTQSKTVREKWKLSSLEKYGTEYPTQSDEIKEKVRQTSRRKYGKDYYAQTDEHKERYINTCMERYGVENYSQSEEYHQRYPGLLKKRLKTMKEHKTFNSSKAENGLEVKLRELFPDLKAQYRSEQYPFKCDFYIPSLDLYIEYNGTWTHGYKFFDKNDENDLARLNELKAKTEKSKFYTTAIEIWTVRDVLKLETAIKNNLNYVAWFNEEQANDWIEAQKKIRIV